MDNGEIPLSESEFSRVKARVYKIAGISLSDAKRTLVISRLTKVVRALNLSSFASYLDFLEQRGTKADLQEFVNALTTNLTRFYREDHHFDHLEKYVGEVIKEKSRVSARPRLRIWSAGCSSGQEPYTIAMALVTKFPELKRWDFKILATDIDTNMLAKAAQGAYPDGELSGLAPARARIFDVPGDGTIRIPSALRELVTFKPLNLQDAWPMKGPFDAIFCRNVAIYFDKPTQAQLFSRLSEMLAPSGFLYIGHSETIPSGTGRVSLTGKTIYQSTNVAKSRDAA